MNEAEKEAEDILFTAGRNMKDEYSFHESAKNEIAQALQKKQDEIERLTKKLSEAKKEPLDDYGEEGVSIDYEHVGVLRGDMMKAFKRQDDRIKELELENQHLANIGVDLKKSEKAFLETINQQGDEIKELEDKIKVAREALRKFREKFEAFKRYQNQHLSKGLEAAEQSWAEVSDSGMLDFKDLFDALAELGEK